MALGAAPGGPETLCLERSRSSWGAGALDPSRQQAGDPWLGSGEAWKDRLARSYFGEETVAFFKSSSRRCHCIFKSRVSKWVLPTL